MMTSAKLQEALGWFKHVLRVEPVVADVGLAIATARARTEMQHRFYAFYCSTFEREVSNG